MLSSRQLHRAAVAALSLLLASLSVLPTAALSQHGAAQVSTAAHRRSTTDGIPDAQQLLAADRGLQLLPGEEVEGIVTGIAGPEAQAEFAAAEALRALDGGRRALLHGKKRPRDYSICPRCTLISCVTGTNMCSGHCKTSRALFTCRTTSRVAPGCPDSELPDPRTLTPDPMVQGRSVQVMATAPFMGCANITGEPNGCPPRGTTGTLAGRGRVEVVTSWCVQHLYELICAGVTPFYPFGHCRCLMRDESGRIFGGPCRTSYLDWSGPDRGPDEVAVSVSTEGGETLTSFAVPDDVDASILSLNHTFPSEEGRITSKLKVFEANVEDGYDLVEEAPLPGVDGDPEGDDEGEFVEEGAPEEGPAGTADEEGSMEEQEDEEEESALARFLRGFKST